MHHGKAGVNFPGHATILFLLILGSLSAVATALTISGTPSTLVFAGAAPTLVLATSYLEHSNSFNSKEPRQFWFKQVVLPIPAFRHLASLRLRLVAQRPDHRQGAEWGDVEGDDISYLVYGCQSTLKSLEIFLERFPDEDADEFYAGLSAGIAKCATLALERLGVTWSPKAPSIIGGLRTITLLALEVPRRKAEEFQDQILAGEFEANLGGDDRGTAHRFPRLTELDIMGWAGSEAEGGSVDKSRAKAALKVWGGTRGVKVVLV